MVRFTAVAVALAACEVAQAFIPSFIVWNHVPSRANLPALVAPATPSALLGQRTRRRGPLDHVVALWSSSTDDEVGSKVLH